jgi:tetratricopeptide (TPR) repeat protein
LVSSTERLARKNFVSDLELTVRLPAALRSLTLALFLAPAVGAQKIAPIPPRPRLDAGADTNDAATYYRYGVQMANSKPAESVKAFYWATQINPGSAEAMYGLRTSTLLAMSSGDLFDYFDWTRKKRSPEYLALDSLLYRAYTVNPFVYRNMDVPLIRALIEANAIKYDPSIDRAELNHDVLERLNTMRREGWLSYAEGRLPDALEGYAKQLHDKGRNKKDHEENDSEIHADRARVFYQMGNMDSARAELTAAITGFREKDKKNVVILYESKAMYEQSLGMINERASKMDDAREAYGQALTEDLSYYSAHSHLAQLQLKQGDTAAAVTEMDLAVQLQPNDPALRYGYAVVLVQSGRDADAVTQLMKSIAADQYYAAPRLLLARISDVEQYTEEAVKGYQEYVALAPRSDPQLATVKTRLVALTSTVAAAPGKP